MTEFRILTLPSGCLDSITGGQGPPWHELVSLRREQLIRKSRIVIPETQTQLGIRETISQSRLWWLWTTAQSVTGERRKCRDCQDHNSMHWHVCTHVHSKCQEGDAVKNSKWLGLQGNKPFPIVFLLFFSELWIDEGETQETVIIYLMVIKDLMWLRKFYLQN